MGKLRQHKFAQWLTSNGFKQRNRRRWSSDYVHKNGSVSLPHGTEVPGKVLAIVANILNTSEENVVKAASSGIPVWAVVASPTEKAKLDAARQFSSIVCADPRFVLVLDPTELERRTFMLGHIDHSDHIYRVQLLDRAQRNPNDNVFALAFKMEDGSGKLVAHVYPANVRKLVDEHGHKGAGHLLRMYLKGILWGDGPIPINDTGVSCNGAIVMRS